MPAGATSNLGEDLSSFELWGEDELTLKDVMTAPGNTIINALAMPGTTGTANPVTQQGMVAVRFRRRHASCKPSPHAMQFDHRLPVCLPLCASLLDGDHHLQLTGIVVDSAVGAAGGVNLKLHATGLPVPAGGAPYLLIYRLVDPKPTDTRPEWALAWSMEPSRAPCEWWLW